jgi:LmbE family N-acetylglucosaminyl deacetylase
VIYTYLSPHLDDAVLSCGGQIHHYTAASDTVLVITLFAGEARSGDALSPFALVQHDYWGNPPRPIALRRAEDQAALALLGADLVHLDHLDAVYRAGPDGQWLYPGEEGIFGPVHADDPTALHGAQDLVEQLVERVPSGPRGQLIVAPLGLGGHVDHQIVHRAALQLWEMGYSVAFFEDYPYAERLGGSAALSSEGWHVESLALDPEDVAAKVAALYYYRTQLRVLFGRLEDMPSRVWAYASTRTQEVPLAERIWRPSHPLHDRDPGP